MHPGPDSLFMNNTYKALRVVSNSWDLYYSVWCTNEHELYDLKVCEKQPAMATKSNSPPPQPSLS